MTDILPPMSAIQQMVIDLKNLDTLYGGTQGAGMSHSLEAQFDRDESPK